MMRASRAATSLLRHPIPSWKVRDGKRDSNRHRQTPVLKKKRRA